MHPPAQFHTHLTFLQEKLACITGKSFPSWDDNHVDGFTLMHDEVLNILDLWDNATVMTHEGWMLTPTKRKHILGSFVQIIMTSQILTNDIDENGKQTIQEIGDILETLGEIILKFNVLEKTP